MKIKKLKNNLKVTVQNMENSNGNIVKNQFEIYTDKGEYFQSYSSLIIFRENKTGQIYLDVNKWDYSVTTGKYRNMFLGEEIAETRKKIESGVYKLVDMN